MSATIRFLFFLGLWLMLPLLPVRLSAQSVSLVPRTASKNLSEAVPAAVPGYNKAQGDLLIVSGRQTKGYHVKALPILYKPDPTGVQGIIRTYFLVNNRVVRTDAVNTGDSLPAYPFPRTDDGDISSKHIQIVAQTEDNERYSLIDCRLYAYSPPLSLDYTAAVNGERGEFRFKDRAKLGSVFCYINEECIGKLNSEATAECDLRHLAPGTYRFAAIAETTDGMILPFRSYAFTIAPRYRLQLPQVSPEVTVRVSVEEPNGALVLRAIPQEACSAALAHVYVDSTYMGDVLPQSPEIALSLKDIPTGKILIEVVPVGKDGLEYPAETLEFHLKNEGWEQRTIRTPEFRQTEANIKQIDAYEKEAIAWFTKAEGEPNFVVSSGSRSTNGSTEGFRFTLPYLSTAKASGRGGEYLAKARTAVMNMAQLTLENARLYRRLKMNAAAKANYRRAIHLAGSQTNTGSIAKGELAAMLLPKR
jgi:hypothetical protein